MLEIYEEAVDAGARCHKAAEVIGVSVRTLQRWAEQGGGDDQRRGPHTAPANTLPESVRQRILEVAESPEFRDVSPKQIVPALADRGVYIASESSFYRVLRAAGQATYRNRSLAPRPRPRPLSATGPNQLWSWDITYLPSGVAGRFFYLYLVLDVWSRRIIGWAVHDAENSDHASTLMTRLAYEQGIARDQLTIHSDNGPPMKGKTLLATLYWLGIATSRSRPSVKDDNPYSESLFRTLKYRPQYPSRRFEDLNAARAWVAEFARWYNHEHRHSAIRFVTPDERHSGRETAILTARTRVYERARKRHPERWSRGVRNWTPIGRVKLNPEPNKSTTKPSQSAA